MNEDRLALSAAEPLQPTDTDYRVKKIVASQGLLEI